MSLSFCVVSTYVRESTLKSTNSLMKWYLTPMCFRRASMCFVRFSFALPSAICFAVTLSHLSSAGSGNGHLKNFASPFAHKISLAQSVNVQYSASHDERVTFFCLLDTASRGPPINLSKYPLVDLLVLGQPAQSLSQ